MTLKLSVDAIAADRANAEHHSSPSLAYFVSCSFPRQSIRRKRNDKRAALTLRYLIITVNFLILPK